MIINVISIKFRGKRELSYLFNSIFTHIFFKIVLYQLERAAKRKILAQVRNALEGNLGPLVFLPRDTFKLDLTYFTFTIFHLPVHDVQNVI